MFAKKFQPERLPQIEQLDETPWTMADCTRALLDGCDVNVFPDVDPALILKVFGVMPR